MYNAAEKVKAEYVCNKPTSQSAYSSSVQLTSSAPLPVLARHRQNRSRSVRSTIGPSDSRAMLPQLFHLVFPLGKGTNGRFAGQGYVHNSEAKIVGATNF